jgi:hypothetical protein
MSSANERNFDKAMTLMTTHLPPRESMVRVVAWYRNPNALIP